LPIIVNKEKKRASIALASKDLLVQNNIDEITISQIAKNAGIGKGTFYEYFKDKNELLFELVEQLMTDYNKHIEQKIDLKKSAREKIKVFYEFFYTKEAKDFRTLYQKFTAVSLLSPSKEIIEFQTGCFDFYQEWVGKIIEESIKNGELKPLAKDLILCMFAMGKGMFIMSKTTTSICDLKKEIDKIVDDVFILVENKKGESK